MEACFIEHLTANIRPALKTRAQPGLSLILATLGRTSEIERFLASIAGSAVPLEVIVVDQNEDHRLDPIVKAGLAMGLDIRHLRIAPAKGLSLARNRGLEHARFELVGFPDDDCWYEAGVCGSIYEAFAGNNELGGVVARWHDRHEMTDGNSVLHIESQRRFSGIPLASICLFFRTHLVVNAGGFDERLGVGTWSGSSEETDLVFRLLTNRTRIEFRSEIVVRHYWPGTSIPVSGELQAIFRGAISRARGTGAMYAKHALAISVVSRGLLAPLLKMLLPRDGAHGLAYWLGTTVGRWQGFLYWRGLRS